MQKHMAQLQRNTLVAGTRSSVLSITSAGKRMELSFESNPICQAILLAAE